MDLNALMHSDNAANIQVVISAKDLRECFESWMKFATKTIKERDEPEYYTREELAALLHVSLPTIYEYRKKGVIPDPVKVGDRVLFDKAKVHEAISSGRVRLKRCFK